MAEDEVVFYFRFYDHACELLIKKEIEWEEEETSTLKTDFFSYAWNRDSKFTTIKLGLKQH